MRTPILKRSARAIGALIAGCVTVQCGVAAVSSDLVAPQKREATVRIAEQLTRAAEPALVPGAANPFNPAGFDGPTPGEITQGREADFTRIANAPPVPRSDRDILESLSARIPAKGTLEREGKMLLSIGPRRVEAGGVITVIDDGGKEFEFEVVAISATTFTLRFHHEEITRPVHSAR